MEKEKQNYDFDNIQSQLDKALGQATRLQKERETVQLDADRLRDKYEKVQVLSYFLLRKNNLFHITLFQNVVSYFRLLLVVVHFAFCND